MIESRFLYELEIYNILEFFLLLKNFVNLVLVIGSFVFISSNSIRVIRVSRYWVDGNFVISDMFGCVRV